MTALIAILAALFFPTPVDSPAPITPPAQSTMFVPEIANDDYYIEGDVFVSTQNGEFNMIGSDFTIQDDMDWNIFPHTSIPEGYYVLSDSGVLVPVESWEVIPSATLA